MSKTTILLKRIIFTLLGILILIYVIKQASLINFNSVSTETAIYTQMDDTIDTTAWIVRNETVITENYSGVISCNFNDGDKVSDGSYVATVYGGEDDVTSQSALTQIENEIEALEKLKDVEDYYSSSTEGLGTSINSSIDSAMLNVMENDFSSISQIKSDLQYLLNQKRIVIGEEDTDDFASLIAELENEKLEILSQTTGVTDYIKTDVSGYFISSLDGYENSFDYDDIENITVDDIESVEQGDISSNAICKISEDFSWYVITTISEQEKIKIESKSSVYIEIPFATTQKIPAEVVSINKDEDTGTYALVLRCTYMSEELSSIRNEAIKIIVNSYSGVLVNESAIYFEDVIGTDEDGNEVVYSNVKGVYVLYASKMTFVQIFSDSTINGYAICKTQLDTDEKELLVTSSTIDVYDQVVIGGSNLYDGKIIS